MSDINFQPPTSDKTVLEPNIASDKVEEGASDIAADWQENLEEHKSQDLVSRIEAKYERLALGSAPPTDEAAPLLVYYGRKGYTPSTIQSLPVELIIEIIKHATGYYLYRAAYSAGYFHRLHILAQVSNIFADIVKKAPELWSVLDSRDEHSNWDSILRLSQSSPLTVRHTVTLLADQSFWSAVLPNVHRWNAASVYFFDTAPWQALDLEGKEAPNLEALVLTCFEQRRQPTFEINLSRMFAPKLRELTLGSIYLRDWAPETLHGLRLLSLMNIHHGLSMQTLLDVLRGCSYLTTLKLDKVDLERGMKDIAAVYLPKLRILHVEDLEGEAVEVLLESIQAPSVVDFSIYYDAINTPYGLNPRLPSQSTTTAPSLAKWFDLCVGSTRFLHIRISETLLRFEMARERQTDITSKFLMAHPFHTSHILNWAAPRLDTSLPLTLTLALKARRYLLPMLERLAPLTGIVELWMYDYGKALHMVLNPLATPRTLPNGARAWLWPKLETIIIESMHSSLAQDVLRMLQSRFGAVASDGVGGSLDAPVQLKELSLTLKPDRRGLRINIQTLGEIRKLLGAPETCAIRWQGTLLEDYPMGTGALQDTEGAGWDFKRTQRRSSNAD